MSESNPNPFPPQPPFPPPQPPQFPQAYLPPQPPRRGKGLMIFAIVLLVLLLVSIAFNGLLVLAVGAVAMGEGGGLTGNPQVKYAPIQHGGNDKVAILPISGVIDEAQVAKVRLFGDAIINDATIKAVVVEVDSPGGGITAADEIHQEIQRIKAAKNGHLLVSMRGLAASGGYYVSMPASRIYAQPTTLVGSIGVIWPAFEMSGLLDKIGVTPEVITSDQAKYKDMGSPYRKFTPEDREYIRGLVNEAHKKFVDIVTDGRKGLLKVGMEQVAIGRIWSAQKALDMGLVDEIAYLNKVIQDAETDTGIGAGKATVVRLEQKISLFDSLQLQSQSPKITLSANSIIELQPTKMEYRWVPPTAYGK